MNKTSLDSINILCLIYWIKV